MEYISGIEETALEACESADSFLQSSMWADFKSRFGWTARAFLITFAHNDKETIIPLLALTRRLIRGFSFAYIPWGPPKLSSSSQLSSASHLSSLESDIIPADERAEAMAQLAAKLKPFLARNTALVRFDFPWFFAETAAECSGMPEGLRLEKKLLLAAGFKQAAAAVQPPDTVIIDLNASCEELLAGMKSKWRYNISLAAKKGVTVKICGVQEIETFYSLLKETAVRDGLAIHNINYYKTLFEICGEREKEDIRLYIASHEGDTLAAITVLFRGNYATYLYGASSNTKRNLMASYALQWKAMQDAKEAGCRFYDLFGIPPSNDPNHPMEGLYRFKTGFGGSIIHRPGSWDYPYKKLVYNLFNIAEKLRKKLLNRKKKRNN